MQLLNFVPIICVLNFVPNLCVPNNNFLLPQFMSVARTRSNASWTIHCYLRAGRRHTPSCKNILIYPPPQQLRPKQRQRQRQRQRERQRQKHFIIIYGQDGDTHPAANRQKHFDISSSSAIIWNTNTKTGPKTKTQTMTRTKTQKTAQTKTMAKTFTQTETKTQRKWHKQRHRQRHPPATQQKLHVIVNCTFGYILPSPPIG